MIIIEHLESLQFSDVDSTMSITIHSSNLGSRFVQRLVSTHVTLWCPLRALNLNYMRGEYLILFQTRTKCRQCNCLKWGLEWLLYWHTSYQPSVVRAHIILFQIPTKCSQHKSITNVCKCVKSWKCDNSKI